MNTHNNVPFIWDREEENQLFDQLSPFLKFNNFNQEPISNNKGFDEITYENKFNKEKCLPCENSFYEGAINFKLLISDLRERQRFDNDFFYYQKYTQNLPKVVFENANNDSFSASPYLEVETSVPFEYTDPKTKKRVATKFKVGLNTRACLVNFKQYGFKTLIDEKDETLRLYVEYIYTDSLDKRIDIPSTENLNDYQIEDKYIAIKLETNNFNDFFALAKEIDLYEHIKIKIKNLFVSKIKATTNAKELDFLYENCPDEVIEIIKRNQEISEEKIWSDLVAITSLDSEKWFTDTSSALLNALKLIGYSDLIYYKFVSSPELVKTIYNNLDGKSLVNGQMMSNKMQFASFIYALCAANGFKSLKKKNKTFKYGSNYLLDSDVLLTSNEKEDEIFLQQLKKETHYYSVQTEMDDFGVTTPISETEVVDVKEIEVDQGSYYKVLDVVYLKDTSQKNGILLPVPAIFIKALSDEVEFQEIEKNIRLGFDIVAVVVGLITLVTTANPGILALAIADVALATGDIAIQGIAKELQKTPEGQEFLKTWEKIYMAGGIATAIISAPQLVQSFYKGATKFIKFAVAAKNYKYLNFARALVLSAYLEGSVVNFIKDTIKIIEPKELFLGFEYNQMAQRMTENGVLFISGKKEGELLDYYAAIYKGEVIEEFTSVSKNKFAGRYWKLKGDKLLNLFEELYNLKYLPNKVIEHASLGEFSAAANPKKSMLPGKMKSGGHGQENIDFLEKIVRKYKIEHTFKNGVRIGAVDGHDVKFKKIVEGKKNTGQSWFPKEWSRAKIKKAGNFVIENNFEEFKKLEDGKVIFDNFEEVRVGVMKTHGKPATIFPDYAEQPIPSSKKIELNPFKE